VQVSSYTLRAEAGPGNATRTLGNTEI
jgi:hypothetical protein